MTDEVRAAIAALEALTADALKPIDENALDRLQNLLNRCTGLISDEEERRDPTPIDVAEQKKETEERQAALTEAIAHCAKTGASAELQARLTQLLAYLS
jgi:methionyl-tRNA synthetase